MRMRSDSGRRFARGNRLTHSPRADEMDIRLHVERRSPRPALGDWRNLPDGAMIALGETACLVLAGELFAWIAGGLSRRSKARGRGPIHLLTPSSIVAALSAGYRARLHSSVLALARAL